MQCSRGQVGVWVLAAAVGAGQQRGGQAGEKDEAARCAVVRGTLFARAAGAADWTPVAADTALRGTTTLVALFEADLRSPNDAVELTLIGDLGQRGRFPVLESRRDAATDFDRRSRRRARARRARLHQPQKERRGERVRHEGVWPHVHGMSGIGSRRQAHDWKRVRTVRAEDACPRRLIKKNRPRRLMVSRAAWFVASEDAYTNSGITRPPLIIGVGRPVGSL